jgi:hypothetical protein
LLIWGGGHFAYAGNEIYGFDLGHLRWQRLSEPSLEIDLDYRAGDDIYIDGKPRSNHTYGSLQYVPVVDRFCSFGTSANFPASRGGPTTWSSTSARENGNASRRHRLRLWHFLGVGTRSHSASGFV